MQEEITRILKMVEEGKIDSEKAAELIDAIREPKYQETVQPAKDKIIKIKVLSEDGDNVNVTLPVKFVRNMIKASGKIPISVDGVEKIDTQIIAEAIDGGLEGKIVDIKDEDGNVVDITIE